MNQLKSFFKTHAAVLLMAIWFATNVLNALRACIPAGWDALFNFVMLLLTGAAHTLQVQNALNTPAPTVSTDNPTAGNTTIQQ